MERVVANVAGLVRKESLNGRSYLVAPMTLIVPGVLDGSEGAIYYPPEEVGAEPDSWNGMPLVGYHPMKDGVPITARMPDVLQAQGIGYVFNVAFDAKLDGEAWFDEDLTARMDRYLPQRHRIIPRLNRREPIEVSTGLFLKKKPVPPGTSHNGKPYNFEGYGFRPDHVAILPDQIGACQVRDGCGVLVNHRPATEDHPMPLTPEQKKAHVEYLVANCAWWKKPGDSAILNSLPDDKLEELHQQAEAMNKPPAPPSPPAPAPAQLTPEQISVLADAIKEKLGLKPAEKPLAPPAPAPVPVAQPVTANQWLETAPEEIRSVVRNAMQREKEEKDLLIGRLTANQTDPAARQAAAQMLLPKSLEELRALHKLLAPANNSQGHQTAAGAFLAAGVGNPDPASSPLEGTDDDILMPLPVINWGRQTQPEAAKAAS